MALIFADRVKETTTTAGTGTLTLSGAVFGYQSFGAIGDTNTTYYAIYDADTGDWEVGIGTYTASGTTLSRDAILSSSNAGAVVSFSSAIKEVFVTYPSERAVYRDSANTYTVQQAFDAATANSIALTTGTVSATPTLGTDIANKTYVDTIAAAGIHYHAPVFVESPNTAGSLNATYNQPGGAGDGVGATLTNAGTQVALTIDGVLMTTTKRVLVYNQTNAFENGVYTVTTVGDGSTNWVLTRATDADTYAPSSPDTLGQGDAFFVTSGNTGAGEGYVCTTIGAITFGTTAITFSQFSASVTYNAGTGLNLNPATTFNISNTGVTATTYGAAATVPVIVVNAQGQITSATDTTIAIPASQVSGLATSATTDTTNAANITSGTLPSGRLVGGYGNITAVGTLIGGTWTADVITAPYGGTGFGTYAVGDLLYANTTTTLAKLADVATGNALISGGVGVAPSWGKIGLATHVSGTLAAANGGTGITSLGTGVATFLGTPSSANLAAAVTDETGSGALVFATSPTLVTPSVSGDLTVNGNLGVGASPTPATGTVLFANNATGGTSVSGVVNSMAIQSDVTSSFRAYSSQAYTTAASFTLPALTHFFANPSTFGAGSAVTFQFGFSVSSSMTGAGTNIGFYGNIASGTNRWNTYIQGTAQNYFAGNVGIGSGKTVPATALDVNGTVTATEFVGAATLSGAVLNDGYTEEVYAVVDAAGVAISPTNGSIQTWTLGASRTPTAGTWAAGQSLTLMINDGTAYTVTWTTLGVVWVGGTAPTLALTGFSVIQFWKVGTTIYGVYTGAVA